MSRSNFQVQCQQDEKLTTRASSVEEPHGKVMTKGGQ